MTISSTNTKNSYSGDGSTVAFSYTFKILDDDDITVILRTNATGAETVQTKTTHYSVSGVGNAGGGTITFVSAPATTVTVVLLRNVPLTQTTDYTPNDPFPAVTHEDALDKLTLMAQDTQEEVDRSIKLSRTNTMTSTEFTVGATDRANKVFAFDSSGELAVTQEIGTFQGNWAASTAYAERDLVKDTSTNNIFIVNSAHTSSGSQPLTTNANASKYDLIVDAASATTSATNAATSATAASNSATAAANSASAAATSESNAAGSEAGVAADAAAAAASAASASTSATNASTSETNASNSASAASTSATNAATSATSASNSASAAGTSESNAATSATNASNSASAAATSASNASTSESNASTSETNAATSASSAASDASAAATSAASAAASFDAFDDIYLGAKASAPTVDNDGDALTNGDLYFDTGDNELYIWNGSAWQAASPNIVADTTPQLGGDLDTNGNDINFGDNDKAVFGAGSDLQIYHDGFDSYVKDAGSGNLTLQGTNLNMYNTALSKIYLNATDGGSVDLYYDNAEKLATTSTGVDVTGTVTADGLTVDGDATVSQNMTNGSSAAFTDPHLALKATNSVDTTGFVGMSFATSDNTNYGFSLGAVRSSGGVGDLVFRNHFNSAQGTKKLNIATGGDISFYDETGVTQGFFWDASTQRLGLGTTSPNSPLEVSNGTENHRVAFGTGEVYLMARNASSYITQEYIANQHVFTGYGDNSSNEAMRIDSSGNVGIGTSSPEGLIGLPATASNTPKFRLQSASTNTDFAISSYADANGTYVSLGANHYLDSSGNDAVFETTDRSAYVLLDARNNGTVSFGTNSSGVATERMRIASSGNVGIGTTTLTDKLNVEGDIRINNAVESPNNLNLEAENGSMRFYTGSGSPSERLRIDSSGNVLVGKTSDAYGTAGIRIDGRGFTQNTRDGNITAYYNRLTSDGIIVEFAKDSTTVGSISCSNSGTYIYFGSSAESVGLGYGGGFVFPTAGGNSGVDNSKDFGSPSFRWDDIYATNSTIQTSDQNEKQQIASLTSAEMTAAKAISALFKTFKWNSSVTENGDAARRHAGVIAQEVQTAMTNAGLDATDYAFWCSDTWWETSTDVAAIEADEEAGIEAREAYTRIDTYNTADEAPEGATERTRLGIRYPELLAFVGAATEQRLADIETRLTALEGA